MVDLTRVVHIRFLIARTICHEIGHSLQNAVFGNHRRSHEVFYKDHKLAEAGFELESQLFGGIFIDFGGGNGMTTSQTYAQACDNGKQRQPELAFHLLDWPSYHVSVVYLHRHNFDIWSGREFSNHDVLHTTPNEFVLSLFTDSFWKDSQKKYDPTSLHPPKIVSWPFTHVDEAHGFLPMPFDEVVDFVGPKRARSLCSSLSAPPEHRPEPLIEDWTDCLSSECLSWFTDPMTYTLSKTQRKRARRREKRAKRALENVAVDECV